MKNRHLILLPFVAGIFVLSSCSQFSGSSQSVKTADNKQVGLLSGAPVANTGAVGGSESHQMDELDRSKLSHALDGGIGKATSWQNVATGIEYTVIPTEKISINGNPFCRKYTITSVKSGQSRESSGTACVSSDGAWHPA